MTEKEFLARCKTIWDAGLATPERLRLLERWIEMVMRLEGGQLNYFSEMLESERERLDGFRSGRTLANDADGYALVQMAAILVHPCQACAEDKNAWWTRAAFCEHKKRVD